MHGVLLVFLCGELKMLFGDLIAKVEKYSERHK